MAGQWPCPWKQSTFRRPFIKGLKRGAGYYSKYSPRSSIAPRPAIDVKHIRQNAELYIRNCIERNYEAQSIYPERIINLFENWKSIEHEASELKGKSKALRDQISHRDITIGEEAGDGQDSRTQIDLRLVAKELKPQLREFEERGKELIAEIEKLAVELPNLTSLETPRGDQPILVGYINEGLKTPPSSNSHTTIGLRLDILDFGSASTTSGWGWYFLKNEGVLLEQALINFAMQVASKHGFSLISPPSMVYSHIADACGFQPRDQGGEQQIYEIAQGCDGASKRRPEMCMAATGEIPFAGMRANTDMDSTQFPMKIVGPSRCYRAEAGSRGLDTKGLYRVHEFTKVEMFGWTLPGQSEELFDTMMMVQKEILTSLGLRCRILEQPSADLGASASRKQDIEAFFPSRQSRNDGWGEVTSTSICTDYQTRRLATRVRNPSGRFSFPHTVNGTAVAVPRVLAAILENHWDNDQSCLHVPEALWPWMLGNRTIARRKS